MTGAARFAHADARPRALRRLRFPAVDPALLWVPPAAALGVLVVPSGSVLLAALAVAGLAAALLAPRLALYAAVAAIPLAGAEVPGAGLPLNEVAVLGAVVVAAGAGMRPVRRLPTAAAPLLVGVPLVVALAGLLGLGVPGPDEARRLLHLALMAAAAVSVGSGVWPDELVRPALRAGLVFAATTSTALFVVGLEPVASYPGRLVGIFGDPNVAALTLVVLGLVVLHQAPSRRSRVMVMAAVAPPLVLTYSRTGLLAAGLAGLWVVVARRASPVFGVVALAAIALAAFTIPAEAIAVGGYGDRDESDLLRDLIYEAEWEAVAANALVGAGPVPPRVSVFGADFHFHSSYLALWYQGGIVALVLVGAGLAALLLAAGRAPTRAPYVEAALVAAIVMAVNLGEVLLELPTVIAVGAALAVVAGTAPRTAGGRRPPPLHAPGPRPLDDGGRPRAL